MARGNRRRPNVGRVVWAFPVRLPDNWRHGHARFGGRRSCYRHGGRGGCGDRAVACPPTGSRDLGLVGPRHNGGHRGDACRRRPIGDSGRVLLISRVRAGSALAVGNGTLHAVQWSASVEPRGGSRQALRVGHRSDGWSALVAATGLGGRLSRGHTLAGRHRVVVGRSRELCSLFPVANALREAPASHALWGLTI